MLERKLTDANLNTIVELPSGLDYNEWLASHSKLNVRRRNGKSQRFLIAAFAPLFSSALALFEHVNLVYGTISEFCTTSGCPDMTGPGNR